MASDMGNLWRPVKALPEQYFTADEVAKSRSYQRPLQVASLISSFLGLVMLCSFVISKAGPKIADLSPWDGWIPQLLTVIVVFLTADQLLGLPIDVWRVFKHEQRWGFNTQTPKLFVVDKLKDTVLSFVIFSVIMGGIYAVVRNTEAWWLYGGALAIFFTVVLATISPTLIMPLFNKFTPLQDEELAERLQAIADRAGVSIDGYKVMDASKRTTKDNAFFAGMGRTRRVVLFDNLLQLGPEKVEIVVAHEIGHWRRGHVLKLVTISSILLMAAFAFTDAASRSRALLDLAGVESIGDPGSFPLFSLLLATPFMLTRYIGAFFSRWFEREADLAALELTNNPGAYAELWRSFSERNLPDLDPTAWKRWKASHPPIAERMRFAELWEESGAQASSGGRS